jgi:hypothetical protein
LVASGPNLAKYPRLEKNFMEKRPMADAETGMEKVAWAGCIVAVQPRIRLMRSFDQRSHSYLGYVLRIAGICGGQAHEFLIGVGKGAHDKYRFCAGMQLSSFSVAVDDPRLETANFYGEDGLLKN